MAQHDYNIANDFFPQVRTDLNNSFSSLASKCSGATDPASAGNATTGGTTYAYQWWVDTGSNKLKIRDATNATWITLADLNTSSYHDLYAQDLTVAGTLTETSSRRYKENIKPITDQLKKLIQLQGVEYDRKESQNHEIGLIAEEVNKVYPDLVSKNNEGQTEGIQYSKLTSVLVESIKELKTLVDNQNNRIQELEAKLGV